MKMNNKQSFQVEANVENGENIKSFSLTEKTKIEVLKFLTAQPYAEVKEYVTLVENKPEFSQEEISNLVTFISQFPICVALTIFNSLVEGIVPNREVIDEGQQIEN